MKAAASGGGAVKVIAVGTASGGGGGGGDGPPHALVADWGAVTPAWLRARERAAARAAPAGLERLTRSYWTRAIER